MRLQTLPDCRTVMRMAVVGCLLATANDGENEKVESNKARSAATIGRLIFSDTGLSQPPGQGCISCHISKSAFADPRAVSPGAVPGRQGTRNAPTLMYAALIPSFAFDDFLTEDGDEVYAWEGGLFHDGRAHDQFKQV